MAMPAETEPPGELTVRHRGTIRTPGTRGQGGEGGAGGIKLKGAGDAALTVEGDVLAGILVGEEKHLQVHVSLSEANGNTPYSGV
jgi:hypothetical protein